MSKNHEKTKKDLNKNGICNYISEKNRNLDISQKKRGVKRKNPLSTKRKKLYKREERSL